MDPELLRAIEALYLPLPYHKFPHAYHVMEIALKILNDLSESERNKVNREVLVLGALLHDAGTGFSTQKLQALGFSQSREDFSCPEDLSTALTIWLLTTFGFEQLFIQQVCHCVQATRPDVDPISLEAALVAAADLYEVPFASFATFSQNAEALRLEFSKAPSVEVKKEAAARIGLWILGLYMAKKEYLPDFLGEGGRSNWHLKAYDNLFNYAEKLIVPMLPKILDLDLGSQRPFVLAHPEDQSRHALHLISRQERVITQGYMRELRELAPDSVVMGLYAQPKVISLPDKSLTRLRVSATTFSSGSISLREMLRVIKECGTLEVYALAPLTKGEMEKLRCEIESIGLEATYSQEPGIVLEYQRKKTVSFQKRALR